MNTTNRMNGLRLSPAAVSDSGNPGAPVKRVGKRGGKKMKVAALVLGVLLVLLGVLVLVAPTIASSIAPGKIEAAAGASIKGTVRVGSVHLGWTSPTEIENLTIVDPDGKTCATMSVKSAATLWRVVSERWWSAKNLDIGETEMSGALDLVRDETTGVTNLQRALEPRVAKTSGASGGGSASPGSSSGDGGIESVKGTLRITKLDATVKDKDAKGALGPEQGVKGLKGTVAVDYAAHPASVAAKVDLSGTPVGPGADTSAMTVKADVAVKPKGGGGLESFKINADVAGLPVAIVDAVAKQGGAMVGAMGTRADVNIDASGTPTSAQSQIRVKSSGLNARLGLALHDGVLASAGPVQGAAANVNDDRISVKSTEFLASVPALRDALARAGAQVKLDKAPGVEIVIDKLRWPLPAGMLEGKSGAMGDADFRGAGLVLRVHVDGMSGKVAMSAPAAGGAGAGAADAPGDWRTFAVEPVDVVVQAEDFGKPLSVSGGTKATIDGSAAGDLRLTAAASGLLDAKGKLRALNNAGFADDVNAEVRVNGMSTALLQPLVAGSGLALDLRQDVGPTLNLSVKASADVKGLDAGKAGTTPPVDATVMVDSQNVKVDGAVRYAGGVVSTTGNGLTVKVATTVPLVQRMMSKPGTPSSLELSGTGALSVTVKDFSAPMDKLSGAEALAAVKAAITAEVSGVGVGIVQQPVAKTATESRGTPQPIQIGKATVNVKLDGANPPRGDVNAAMSHEGAPFEVVGQVTLDGITGGKLPAGAKGAAQVIAFKPTGMLEARNVPRSVANLLPSAAMVGTGSLSGHDAVTQVYRALRESIGATASVAMTTKPEGNGQGMTVKVTTANGGIAADVAAKMTEKDVTVSALSAVLGMEPRVVNPVLASQGGTKNPPRSGGVPSPMSLANPFKLTVKSGGAITVPLKAGTFQPDFAGASDAAISLATDNDIAIDNVPIGEDANGAAKTTGVRVSGLKMDVKAPLAGLAPGGASKRMNATFSALAQRSASGNEKAATIADVSGTVAAGMDGSTPDANVKLASIDTAVVENLIGKPGVLTGGLGATAEATLRVQPQDKGQAVSIALTAPKVSDAKIELFQSAEKLAITKPAVITWKPDAEFLNKTLFAPVPAAAAAPASAPSSSGIGGVVRKLTGEAPSQPAAATPSSSVKVASVSPVTISISKFAMATTVSTNGQVTSGPLKPGVFELDASVSVPTMGLAVSGGAGGSGAAAAATTIGLEGITAKVTHAPAQGGFGEIVAVLGIDKVTGGGNDATRSVAAPGAPAKKTGATVRIANLADARGVMTSSAAVVNLDADVVAFPTIIVDQLAHQKGVMAELLGPTVDIQAKGTNVSMGGGDMGKASGAIQVKASSPRASAEINGDIKGGAFVQSGPINARILAISPELVKMLAGALPVVETIEKKPGEQPGTGDAKGFTVPVDGDLTKLNGDLTIDPGVAKFTTKSIFGDFIKAFGGKTEGTLGQKMEPFVVHANKGVLTYDKFKLPAGQFSVETRGTVDLVRRQIDVVTYAPAGALTEKALGKIAEQIPSQLRGLLQEASIPFVTKGPLDNYTTAPDFGLLVKELGEKIKKEPGKIIGDILGDVLKPKPKPTK
jgi:hypothetical protein